MYSLPASVAPSADLSDVDDTNLESATITLTNHPDGASELLAVDVTGTSNALHFVINLTAPGMIVDTGSSAVPTERWAHRSRAEKALSWIAYGVVRVAMGMLRYGGNEWWRGRG